jgi:hypothetical protein
MKNVASKPLNRCVVNEFFFLLSKAILFFSYRFVRNYLSFVSTSKPVADSIVAIERVLIGLYSYVDAAIENHSTVKIGEPKCKVIVHIYSRNMIDLLEYHLD